VSVNLVSNVRAVLPGRVAEDATLAYEDGVILSVEEGRSYRGAADGRGAMCLPGLIDTHCDALEREIFPRRTAELDVSFALRCLEGRFVAAGVTTAFQGVHFGETYQERTIDLAVRVTGVIAERRQEAAPMDHRILYRIGARSSAGLDEALNLLGLGQNAGDAPLMSFEDHTPGQGQYRDIEQFKAAIGPQDLPPGEDVDSFLAKRMASAEARMPALMANRQKLSALASERAARVLAHDADDAEAVRFARDWGAAVAEFPVTVEAAKQARELGMPVVMGAPNVMRRASHSGNVSAEEMVGAGLCTSLASDYLPASLLAAVFALVERGVCSLPDAVGLVTSGPAEVGGLADRGRLEPGLRSDFVLVELDGAWPRVMATCRPSPPAIGDDQYPRFIQFAPHVLPSVTSD
jgi:alpha-D-ribose 1-methylphosphonate 5-triphosphate diphosphatase